MEPQKSSKPIDNGSNKIVQRTPKINKGHLKTPYIKYLSRRRCWDSDFLDFKENKVTIRPYCNSDEDTRKIWVFINAFYKVHGRKNIKDLYYSQPTGFYNLTAATGSEISQNFRELSHLRIFFGACKYVTDSDLERFGARISHHLPSLKALELSFRGCIHVTGKSLKRLGLDIGQQICNLKAFRLIFRKSNIGNKDIEGFGFSAFRYLVQLERLQLRFEQCLNIDETGIGCLIAQINKYLPNLRLLSIYVANCGNITDVGLSNRASKFSKYPIKLEYFENGLELILNR